MARGRLEPPNLDDRTWQDLVDQARQLIPRYAPEWTDLGPGDPGMTLVELFAWLVEGMIYRLNRVPEKNYVAFLNLLGITRSAATPATTWLTFLGNRKVTIPAGTSASTQQTESQPAIVFETDEPLTVLPSNLVKVYVDESPDNPPARLTNLTDRHVGLGAAMRAVISPKAVTKTENKITTTTGDARFWFGFDTKLDGEGYKLHIDVAHPAWEGKGELTLFYSQEVQGQAKFEKIEDLKRSDGTDGLRRSGEILFIAPSAWAPVT